MLIGKDWHTLQVETGRQAGKPLQANIDIPFHTVSSKNPEYRVLSRISFTIFQRRERFLSSVIVTTKIKPINRRKQPFKSKIQDENVRKAEKRFGRALEFISKLSNTKTQDFVKALFNFFSPGWPSAWRVYPIYTSQIPTKQIQLRLHVTLPLTTLYTARLCVTEKHDQQHVLHWTNFTEHCDHSAAGKNNLCMLKKFNRIICGCWKH